MDTIQKEQLALDKAVWAFRAAYAQARLCGYVSTVREEHERYVEERWKKLERHLPKKA